MTLEANPHYQAMAQLYAARPERAGGWTLDGELEAYRQVGWVIATGEFLIWGKPVRKDAEAEDILNPKLAFKWQGLDCWLVAGFSGDMRAGIAALPFWLPWVCWQRGFHDSLGLRFVRMERLLGRVNGINLDQH